MASLNQVCHYVPVNPLVQKALFAPAILFLRDNVFLPSGSRLQLHDDAHVRKRYGPKTDKGELAYARKTPTKIPMGIRAG
jgi:hypothetical protein